MDAGTRAIVEVLKQARKIYREEGLDIVGLFGSYATGTHDRFSDIDIAYRLDRPRFSERYRDGFSKLARLEEVKRSLQHRLHKRVDFVALDTLSETVRNDLEGSMIYV